MKGQASGATALLALPLLLLVLISRTVTGSTENSRAQCESAVKKWAEHEIWAMEEAEQGQVHSKWKLQDLLFFLHIPRTGGRNYNQCFLKNLFVEDELCPRSYDKLRLDPSKPHCSLFSTHDDYSIVTKFPRATTSIITNMRDPTHRVLSAYEFSVEVAARFLRRSKTFVRRAPVGPKSSMKSMSTLDIWPWKYLVPLLQHDLFDRRDLRLTGALPPKENSNVYDVPSHVMPLKEFIDHPVVHEIIHNGATFQVAGITNNSYVEGANEVRSCVAKYEELGDHVLSVAKRRLDGMLYVGLTEKHKESAEVFAHLVGHQVAKRKLERASKETNDAGNSSKRQKDAKTVVPVDIHPISSDAANESASEDFIDQMVTSYQRCSSTIRSAQVSRRISSLDAVAPVNFSKEARKTIPEDVLARILQLNSLDFELYQHAKKLFEVEQDFLKNHADELKKLDDNKIDKRTFSTNTEHAQRIWRVVEPSTSFVVGVSIFMSLLGMYFFINCYFSRRDRPRAKFQSLKK